MITIAAWVLAGVALWFTRGVLDMFGDATQSTRVAMLPSVAELAGLIVLALIVAAGVAAVVERWPRQRTSPDLSSVKADRSRRSATAEAAAAKADLRLQLALPLFALILTALPYLPWLADWLPPVRALAGPFTTVIWFVVVGHVLLAALSLRRPSGAAASSKTTIRMLGTFVIFGVTFAVAGTAAIRLRHSITYPSGAEAHSMVAMQSLWRDHDLRIANNYDRQDYDEYYASSLAPEPSVPGRNGQLYPARPIGLVVLGAMAFGVGGYDAITWMMLTLTALTAAIMWRRALAATGSAEAATMGWLAVFLGAPVLFTSFAVYPEIPAAFCVMLAFASPKGPDPAPMWTYAARGFAVGVLPWLSITYAPLGAALAVLLATRPEVSHRGAAVLVSVFSASLLLWFGYYFVVWGVASPFAPNEADVEIGNVVAGMLGLLFDQEFGLLAYAPALALGIAGAWRLAASSDGAARRRGREIAILFSILLVGSGALEAWWGSAAPPARPLVPVLPLLGLGIAGLYRRSSEAPVSRAAYHTLIFAGLAVSASLLFAHNGELIAQDRDGSSRLLQWLTELWPAWEAAPSIAAFGLNRSAWLILLWVGAAVGVSALCARSASRSPGVAAVCAISYVGAGVLSVALVAPIVARPRQEWVFEPQSRSRVPMLDNFDAVARPHAVVYDPLTLARTDAVPRLMTLAAFPGQRQGGQPIPVLLNARYALPAGEYEVEIQPDQNQPRASGHIALQIGRIGSPMREWEATLAPGQIWRASFDLPVDAEFVGLVARPPLDSPASIRIRPARIVDRSRRMAIFHGGPQRTVLSAAAFPAASVFFHDEEVHPEATGIWIRGRTTAVMTVAPRRPSAPTTLRVHSGDKPNTLSFVTTTWGETVHLAAGVPRDVRVPAPPQPGPFLLQVSTEKGFVPAEVMPGSTDRRLLGAWMEFTD